MFSSVPTCQRRIQRCVYGLVFLYWLYMIPPFGKPLPSSTFSIPKEVYSAPACQAHHARPVTESFIAWITQGRRRVVMDQMLPAGHVMTFVTQPNPNHGERFTSAWHHMYKICPVVSPSALIEHILLLSMFFILSCCLSHLDWVISLSITINHCLLWPIPIRDRHKTFLVQTP